MKEGLRELHSLCPCQQITSVISRPSSVPLALSDVHSREIPGRDRPRNKMRHVYPLPADEAVLWPSGEEIHGHDRLHLGTAKGTIPVTYSIFLPDWSRNHGQVYGSRLRERPGPPSSPPPIHRRFKLAQTSI